MTVANVNLKKKHILFTDLANCHYRLQILRWMNQFLFTKKLLNVYF